MSEAVGELVFRGESGEETRVPLHSAATLVGSAEGCDVRRDGLAPWHGVVANTPAGPAWRSLAPGLSLVNGEVAVECLLRSGDVLELGGERAEFVWHWGDLVELTPELIELELEHADAPIELEAIVDQAESLAELIDRRHQQLTQLFDEIVRQRETLRQVRGERGRADRRTRRETAALNRRAKAERARVRALARRWAKRYKLRHAAERESLVAGRAQLAKAQEHLVAEAGRWRGELAGQEARLAEGERRLRDAWELVAEGQRRALTGRRDADELVVREREAVAAREAEVAAAWRRLDADHGPLERRVAELRGEIERLERRADHAQAAVQKLEAGRGTLAAATVGPMASSALVIDRVSLDAPSQGGDALALLDDLHRERSALAKARSQLTRHAADLFDQRRVVAEQLAGVVVVQHAWHEAEGETVAELEALARQLVHQEQGVEARERAVRAAEERTVSNAQELWRLRLKLEAWQSALATHEAHAGAARQRGEAEAAAKRHQLETWEASLGELCREWAQQRRGELAELRGGLDRLADMQESCRRAEAASDGLRAQLLADIEVAAAAGLAAGEVQQRLQGIDPGVTRRLRVAQRRWERHFRAFRHDLDARRTELARDAASADRQRRALADTLVERQVQHARHAQSQEDAARERLAQARELDERATRLAVGEVQSQEANLELRAVRAEVDRLALVLIHAEPPQPEYVPLEMPALLSAAPAA